ncbi:MAG: cupin domain-containing protein [Atopobiaceae bacterium]|jgi:4-carboxymuconolactone decarboxylase|nr:cupin domain-containing protein [Atopobiaceae bacterium]MCI2174066.1 cupin domain-containing protein [Atopobiaceae bacterium]MCI2207844.1 cupin domain-containing protein [Atopobiaceae bacterium]
MVERTSVAADGGLFGKGQPNTAYASYFVGESYLNPLVGQDVNVANVTFEPGCRNDWHIHHVTGQILLVTDGEGWYQEWGEQARKLVPGDVVYIAPEVKHWHGATRDSWFCHVAISAMVEGATSEWLEPVADEDYAKLD